MVIKKRVALQRSVLALQLYESFLANESPLKMMKNVFHLNFKK